MKAQLAEFCAYLSGQKVLKKAVNQDDIINNFITLHTIKLTGFDEIVEVVAKELLIDPGEIKHKTRKRETVEARQIAMWMLKKYTKLSLTQIGNCFEFKDHRFDHATVLHACKTVNNLRATDKKFRDKFERIKLAVENKTKIE